MNPRWLLLHNTYALFGWLKLIYIYHKVYHKPHILALTLANFTKNEIFYWYAMPFLMTNIARYAFIHYRSQIISEVIYLLNIQTYSTESFDSLNIWYTYVLKNSLWELSTCMQYSGYYRIFQKWLQINRITLITRWMKKRKNIKMLKL